MKWSILIMIIFTTTDVFAGRYHYKYTDNCAEAYRYYLSLQPEKGRAMLKKELMSDPYNLMATYISDYEDCLLLLFNGNSTDYAQLKGHLDNRIEMMERGDEQSPWHRLCKAGVYMHWAFVNIRFNEKLKAATNFRKSFILLKENKKLFPNFEYNDIFLGIEEATVGAIPDNFKWVASIFGVKGNIKDGAAKVERFIERHDSNDPLYNEALVYYAYMSYYLLSDKEKAWATVSGKDFKTDDNLLNSFVKSNIALNYRKANDAVVILKNAVGIDGYARYPIFNYEYGYALLHKQHSLAIQKFDDFLEVYRGKIFIKDSWQKLAFAYYLDGNMKMATYCRSKIAELGNAETDSDKQAMRFAASSSWPHKILLQSQLLIDGGYYTDAYNLLTKNGMDSYKTESHKLEYFFRMGRVHDELNKKSIAIKYYNLAIETGKNRPEQFAARAALQLGFLYEGAQDASKALGMYNLALSMKNHDFKNSIDQQAKAGINRLSNL